MVTEAAGKYQETHKREITDRESGLIFLGGTQVGAFTLKQFLLEDYPKSKEFRKCYMPAFWLDVN
jgi:hypothetical protein